MEHIRRILQEPFSRLLLVGYLVLVSVVVAFGQERNEVSFYYLLDGQIHTGSMVFVYELKEDGRQLPYSKIEIIDCRRVNAQQLRLDIRAERVKWGAFAHNERLKLIFSDQLSEVGGGLRKPAIGNVYMRSADRSKPLFSLSLGRVDSLQSALHMFGFIVAENATSFQEAYNDDGSAGKDLGRSAFLKTLTLVPAGFSGDQDEVELLNTFQTLIASSLNEVISELTYEMTLERSKGNFDEIAPDEVMNRAKRSNKDSKSDRRKPNKYEAESPIYTAAAAVQDSDYTDFQAAKSRGTASAYRDYLSAHPNGRYVEAAQVEIVRTTPFRIRMDESTDRLFNVYTINFLDGVGKRPPKVILTDNDDGSIRAEFSAPNTCVITLPPERSTRVTFSLPPKDTTFSLTNSRSLSTAAPAAAPEQQGGSIAAANTMPPYWGIKAALLAVPFLMAIFYILNRKYSFL